MLVRSSTAGLLAAMALSLSPDPTSYFTLESSGAIRLAVRSEEARYGMVPETVNRRPVLAISLGATSADGSLSLFTYGDEEIRPGRYRVSSALLEQRTAERWFHPCLVVGAVEHPLGFFHGETGWVTITASEQGRISGEFEIRARGFLASNPDDEEQWVTVQGTFTAAGDSTVVSSASLTPLVIQ
jgi:hypothetical protein